MGGVESVASGFHRRYTRQYERGIAVESAVELMVAEATNIQVANIDSDGQLTVPLEVREELGLGEGDPVAFERRDGYTIVRRATIVEQAAGAGAPWRKYPPLTPEEEEEALARAIGEEGARYE